MLVFEDITRSFGVADRLTYALRELSLTVEAGERVVLMGPSGSGKSTLLHLAAGLDRPTSGRVLLEGSTLASLTARALARLRRERVGFVFQFFNLVPTLTVRENVALPPGLAHLRGAKIEARIDELVERVGMTERAARFPAELSGGEMQRVAVARALVMDPDLILADEPTGNLDSENGRVVMDLLRDMTGSSRTLIMATHDPRAERIATRVVSLRDGQVESDHRS